MMGSTSVLRLRLTNGLLVLRRPEEAVDAKNVMRALKFTAHDRLDLLNLYGFLQSRLAAYRQGDIEALIDRFLAYVEMRPRFDLMFSLAVYIIDSTKEVREVVNDLNRSKFLF